MRAARPVVTSPGTTTSSVPNATSAPSVTAPPERNLPSCRLACEPANTTPATKAPVNSSRVQPNPIVAVSATSTATSRTA